jgi:hypothetical protein
MADTLGNLIDKLTIANLRIWMLEDIKRNPNATDTELANATKKTNVINQQRNDLIQEIDELLLDTIAGKPMKSYKQGSTKMYGGA